MYMYMYQTHRETSGVRTLILAADVMDTCQLLSVV